MCKSYRSSTGFKGVSLDKRSGRFSARIRLFRKTLHLGFYNSAKEASEVVCAFAAKDYKVYSKTTRSDSKTGYFGVSYDPRKGGFQAQCKGVALGYFETIGEAAQAVNDYIIRFKFEHLLNDIKINDIIEANRAKERRQKEKNDAQEKYELQRPKIKTKQGPEYSIQQAVIRYLEDRDWMVKVVNAGLYNFGFPDLVACHKNYGIKFIEIKQPVKNVSFTPAQYKYFPEFCRNGAPIYILTSANEENYQRLFDKSNLWIYMGKLNFEGT